MFDRSGRQHAVARGATRRPLSFRLLTKDRFPLSATLYPGTSARSVVLAGAMGVPQSYYRKFASFLAGDGMNVLTFDYRGIGGSRPENLADLETSLSAWGELDLSAALAFARDELGDGRPAFVGHSVGGQILGLAEGCDRLSSAITVASQSGDYRLWPGTSRYGMALLWYLMPSVTRAFGYFPGSLGIGEDLPRGVALEWSRWGRTPGYLLGDGTTERRDRFARVSAPLLAFGFDDDTYAPPDAVDACASWYAEAATTRRQVPREARVGHFGFFREKFRSSLWQEAATFLSEHREPETPSSVS